MEYLDFNNYTAYFGSVAVAIFNNNKIFFEEICGDILFDTLDGVFSNIEKNEIRIILINKGTNYPTSLFLGYIEENTNIPYIESSYTCSRGLKNGGALLRFLGFLIANEINPSIKIMKGSISGGIPAITENDTKNEQLIKKQNLIDYHKKRGALIIDGQFKYTLYNIIKLIPGLFTTLKT